MTIKELCDGYRTLTTAAQKTDYLKKHVKISLTSPSLRR